MVSIDRGGDDDHPAETLVRWQITEAFPRNEAPRYLIRDRDAIYGVAVTR